MRASTLAFLGLVLVCVCWLAGLIVCGCALGRRDGTLVDGHGLSLSGALVIATVGVVASQLLGT